MTILLTILYIVVCLFLIVVVLLQSGKAADLAGAFGGMGSQTAFGPRGSATVLSKATTLAAALFMIASLGLAILQMRDAGSSGSVLERQKKVTHTQPATPGKPGVTVTPRNVAPAGTPIPIPLPASPAPGQKPAQPAVPKK
jgi:preprotein translocase subunit SecG